MNFSFLWTYLKARMQERSSWLNVLSALSATGLFALDDAKLQAVAGLGVAVGVLLGVFLPDKPASGSTDSSTTLKSSVLIPIGVVALLAVLLCGCMVTTSDGTQVVLTPSNAVPVVMDRIKASCQFYDANKVTVDELKQAAQQAVNDATVNDVSNTVQHIADMACPIIEKLVAVKFNSANPG